MVFVYLLRGTEAPICHSDLLSREVCCWPGPCIKDVTERLSDLVHPTDYCLLLLFHVGTHDTSEVAVSNLKSIRGD